MMPAGLPPALVTHVWQSTVFAVLVWLLTLALRSHHPRVRYWLWVAASIKFVVPFAWLVAAGAQIEWQTAPAGAQPVATFVVDQVLAPIVIAAPSQPRVQLSSIVDAADCVVGRGSDRRRCLVVAAVDPGPSGSS